MAIEGLNRIIAAMSCGVIVLNADGVIVLANQGAVDALGVPLGHLIGRTSAKVGLQIIQQDGTPFPAEHYPSKVCLATRQAQQNVVMGVYRPDGTLRWLSVAAKAVFADDDTTTDGVVVTFIDITEQETAKQALTKSERAVKALFDNLDDVFYQTDAQGRFTLLSPSAYAVCGYRPEELYGTAVADLYVEPGGREKFLAALQASGGSIKGYEMELRRKDGSTIWISTNVHYRYDSEGNICGVEGSVRDITPARLVAQALHDSEALFRTFFQHALLGVVLATSDGKVFRVNHTMERLFGYSEAEFKELRFSDYAVEKMPLNMLLFNELIEGRRGSYQMEKQFLRKDGSLFWGNYMVSAVRDQHGEITRVFTMIEDISARINAEREQKHLQHQLQQAQKMQAIGQLTGGIAHDFNNILSSILGYAELALEHHLPPGHHKLQRALEEIVRGGRRAEQLIAQMLAFSRGRPLDSAPMQVEPLLDELVTLVSAALPASLQLERQRAAQLPVVNANPVQLHQVLLNLVINARDALQGKGTISLTTRHGERSGICSSCHRPFHGKFVEIEVSDSAGTLPLELVEHIFEPFFTTKAIGHGSGMGLAMVHGIMHEWGGHIRVAVVPNRATAFHLYLPALHLTTQTQPSHMAGGSSTVAQHDSAYRLRDAHHILVVDDEVSLGCFIAELLKIHGYRASYYSDSRLALEAFEQHPDSFSLLLSDQTMPQLTGVDLAAALHTLRPELPVVICSGYSEQVNEANIAQFGCDYFLTKPLDTTKLLAVVAQLLTQHVAVHAAPG